MPPDFWEKVTQAYRHLRDLPPEQRTTFLAQLRSDEPDVATELERLDESPNQYAPSPDGSTTLQSDHPPRLSQDAAKGSDGRTPKTPSTPNGNLPPTINLRGASHNTSQQFPTKAGRYVLQEEIARGGMGAVLRAHDQQIDRTLAVKVMLSGSPNNARDRIRFLEEAKITGQLQHPGIPPVYEIGELENGSPFFAMKLIEGQTLAELLQNRSDPKDLPRLLGIFGQVCQTLAYAHSRGILHRDLKPSNIMVGAFAEVQVMDWGLAKVLSAVPEHKPPQSELGTGQAPDATDNRQFLVSEDTDLSYAGEVMGTPAYMAPEQARGEGRNLDPRVDVFGLGAILCEILTGSPAFRGSTLMEKMAQASNGDVQDAFERLDQCGVDAELVDLCKWCLAPHREDRPADGAAVAVAVEHYEHQAQERVRQAEILGREAQVQTQEERKRRLVQLALGVVVLVLILGIGAAALWYQNHLKQKAVAQREQQIQNQRDDFQKKQDAAELQTILLSSRKLHEEFERRLRKKNGIFALQNRRHDWLTKFQKVNQTLSKRGAELVDRLEGEKARRLKQQLENLRTKLSQDLRDWQFAAELGDIHERRMLYVSNDFDDQYALRNYPLAFEKVGLRLFQQGPAEVSRRIKRMRIRDQVLGSLYDWAIVAFRSEVITKDRNDKAKYEKVRKDLLKIVALIDHNPWAKRLHDPDAWAEFWSDQDALESFIKRMPADTSPHVVIVVEALTMMGSSASRAWREMADTLHEHNFAITFEIGTMLLKSSPQEATGYFRAAVNIKPNSSVAYSNWGSTLNAMGRYRKAIGKFRKAIEINPDFASPHNGWGLALHSLGKYRAAIVKYQKALWIDPKLAPVYINWGNALDDLKKYDEASEKYRKAIELNPNDERAYYNWGNTLLHMKKYREAIAKYQKAIEIKPNLASAYVDLGNALSSLKKPEEAIEQFRKATAIDPNDEGAYASWGFALHALKKHEEAIKKFQKGIKLRPNYAKAHYGWGDALYAQQKYDEAIEKLRRATTIDPKLVGAHFIWGTVLDKLERREEAIEKYKKVTQLDPDEARAYHNWAVDLNILGRFEEALPKVQKAIELQPSMPTSWFLLGLIHGNRGKFREAVRAFKKVGELVPERHPFRNAAEHRAKLCQTWIELETKLDAVLANKTRVSDRAQKDLITLCVKYRKRYCDAAKLYAALLQRNPKLGQHPSNRCQFRAVRAAVLAASGRDIHAKQIDAEERTRLRQQARLWLRANVEANQTLLKKERLASPAVADRMRTWRTNDDLASVRDKTALAKLAKDECQAWTKLWDDVQQLEKAARSRFTETTIRGTLIRPEATHPITLQSGRLYVIEMRSKQFDAFLRLHDSEGKKVAENDDGLGGRTLNARIEFTPEKSGTYRLVATSFGQRGRGKYELVIREFPPHSE